MTQQASVETKIYATRLVILKKRERKVHLIEIEDQYFSLGALVKDLVEMTS